MIIAPQRIVCLSAEAADWLWRNVRRSFEKRGSADDALPRSNSANPIGCFGGKAYNSFRRDNHVSVPLPIIRHFDRDNDGTRSRSNDPGANGKPL